MSSQSLSKALFRYILDFFLVNIFLAFLIIINYFSLLPNFFSIAESFLSGLFIWIFFFISFLTQIALLFFLPFLFLVFLFIIYPRKEIIFIASILMGTILLFVIVADSITFGMYHMHYASVAWEVFKVNAWSQVISLSFTEVIYIFSIFLLLILIESLITLGVWRYINTTSHSHYDYLFSIIIIFCTVISYSTNFLVRFSPDKNKFIASNSNLLIKSTRFIPYYDEVFRLLIPIHDDVRYVETATGKVAFQIHEKKQLLDYPKHVLQCMKSTKPINIVVIAIDTWRYDSLNAKSTPHIYQFSQKASQFKNHWSGGNCTKAGVFSLFYGIPANYWEAVLDQKQGPELIHQLIQANYNIGVFASAQLNFPAFDKTIFREVKSLDIYTEGPSTLSRDHAVTQKFKKFLSNRNSNKPFFSFIFYDAAHNYCESPPPTQHPFIPWQKNCNRIALTIDSDPKPYLNRYLNAVYFVDNEVNEVLTSLDQQHLLENTMVMITGDHGEEINDNHSGYWEHASAHTAYQLHVPLLIYWPNQPPKILTHFTTHYDFVPTIMKYILNCQNPVSDYSIGKPLFSTNQRGALISGSYGDYGILTKDQIIRVYSGGDYEINDENGHSIHQKIPLKTLFLQQAYQYLNRYFK